MLRSGVRPIIIIDELQALEGIYLNGQRELLKEMFNFFVAMTKESHLCHVIIASSDGYFIERIYNDSKLKKTSTFMSVDYLTKEDTYYWLNNLEKESGMKNFALSEVQKDEMWNVFGGSCWEVSAILGDLQDRAVNGTVPQEAFDETLQKYKVMQRSKFYEYASLYKDKIAMFLRMAEVVAQKAAFTVGDFAELVEHDTISIEKLTKHFAELVRQNVLAYNPTTSEFSLQGRSMEVGLLMYAEMMKKT
ncbi:MAG: ATP-binding protein [Thermoguttaceae bacterium]